MTSRKTSGKKSKTSSHMHSLLNYAKQHRKQTIAVLICLGVVVLGLAYLYDKPRDIGPNIHLAKTDHYGCIFLCDSTLGTVYYFTTDMNLAQLKTYFTHAKCENEENMNATLTCGSGRHAFNIEYTENTPENLEHPANGTAVDMLKSTHANIVIEMDKGEYRAAKAAL